jgi:hypothetical protein
MKVEQWFSLLGDLALSLAWPSKAEYNRFATKVCGCMTALLSLLSEILYDSVNFNLHLHMTSQVDPGLGE